MDEKNTTEEKEQVTENIEEIEPKSSGKFWAIISYLGVLSLIPLVVRVKSDFARFHLKRGVVLFISEIIFTLIWIIPIIGWVIGSLGWILCILFSLIGIIKASSNKEWKMPLLGKFAKKIRI